MDLVFLDIEMGGMDGMEAARRPARAGCNPRHCFLTGTPLCVDGYA